MSTETILVEGSGTEVSATLSVWLRDLTPITPGCVPSVRRRALVLACREFFEQSTAWRVVVGPKQLKADRKRYMLSPYDAYADVVQVLSAEMDGVPLRPYSRRPAGKEPDMDRPLGYYMDGPDTVRFWPTSATTIPDSLTFYVALTPKQSVRLLPRIALTHFYDAIFDGAAGRLVAQPAKPYTNPTLAQYHLKRFRAAIGAYAAKAKGGMNNTPSWTFPRFGK